MFNHRDKLLILLAAQCMWATPSALAQEKSVEEDLAQRFRTAEHKSFVSVSVENDSLSGGTDQFYTSGVRPAMPGSGYFETPDQGWSWFLFGGLDGRAIARNTFLDGNTFENSHSVDKKYFVGDASAGVAFTLGDYRLSYAINARSKEFDGQDDESVFGSITLSTRF